jgi:cytoskeleton-associated protein 5
MPPPRTYSGENHFSEGKENMPEYEHSNDGTNSNGKLHRQMSTASSGRGTPSEDGYARPTEYARSSEYARPAGGATSSSMSRNPSGGGDGVESWKRAAEVTQNLKARIEMMKVSSVKEPVSITTLEQPN